MDGNPAANWVRELMINIGGLGSQIWEDGQNLREIRGILEASFSIVSLKKIEKW
jgi:hypothetical protein